MPSTAFAGPYVDQSITTQGPYSQSDAAPNPAKSNAATLGEVSVYNITGRLTSLTDIATANASATTRAYSPNSWTVGRDPYANGGMVGQTFFNNQA